MMNRVLVISIWGVTGLLLGCIDDEITEDEDAGGADVASTCSPRDSREIPEQGDCAPLKADYAPCEDDTWDSCISDDGEYHKIEETISSIARVNAFESIAELLFDPKRDASEDDFLDGRLIYQQDEGLDSRVVRRYDPHFEVPEGTQCSDEGVPDSYPDYCVGPARIQPILLDAFNAGIDGIDPRIQAARIEAALLWFLYVSPYKESLTCTTKAKDCDSSYAYYTGGEPARGGIGLSRYIQEVNPLAHDRAWDGLLAVRCWRDLDSDETAARLELRDRARNQYDRALLNGIASIVRHRFDSLSDTTGDERGYHWAFLQVLGPVLDFRTREVSPTHAAALQAELEKADPDEVEVEVAVAAIDSIFDCP